MVSLVGMLLSALQLTANKGQGRSIEIGLVAKPALILVLKGTQRSGYLTWGSFWFYQYDLTLIPYFKDVLKSCTAKIISLNSAKKQQSQK